jgi:hypothetical protein
MNKDCPHFRRHDSVTCRSKSLQKHNPSAFNAWPVIVDDCFFRHTSRIQDHLVWLSCLQMKKPEPWRISRTPYGITCVNFRVSNLVNCTDHQALLQT